VPIAIRESLTIWGNLNKFHYFVENLKTMFDRVTNREVFNSPNENINVSAAKAVDNLASEDVLV
jgi:hypothetical protein